MDESGAAAWKLGLSIGVPIGAAIFFGAREVKCGFERSAKEISYGMKNSAKEVANGFERIGLQTYEQIATHSPVSVVLPMQKAPQ